MVIDDHIEPYRGVEGHVSRSGLGVDHAQTVETSKIEIVEHAGLEPEVSQEGEVLGPPDGTGVADRTGNLVPHVCNFAKGRGSGDSVRVGSVLDNDQHVAGAFEHGGQTLEACGRSCGPSHA